jgi:ABC-2 type transport system ATP-binding protein
MKTSLETHCLTHKFGEKVALNNLNLSVPARGVTALLGANGAGKTTLINCALGLCKPSSGSLSLFGKTPGLLETKRLIGVMLQDADLPDLLTAREHINLFSAYYENPLSLDELAQRCELSGLLDSRYKHLSGGQKRRVQFALAILGRPKMVFLDEPTTGLDIDARKVVWNTINELNDTGTAVLLTTHYLEEADTLADRTIVMSGGSIIANDTTDNIRAAASGAVIRFETSIELPAIKRLPNVRSIEVAGRFIEVLSSNASTTLMELLKLDSELKNLTVANASLEDAFLQLTNSHNAQGEQ